MRKWRKRYGEEPKKHMDSEAAESYGNGLIDLSRLTLGEVAAIESPALKVALRRLLAADSGPVAGFQSAL
ncbi:FXSXX-COOH protein [Nonomuraea maritima]|uniref:FXSXX-COOH protein n=2 Tax=Nonomuraea maritima TaxID=683260 RepID=A0A1G8WML1_9ACTN|nr:FXSXX-COOH protein [Nonomuraea maritima]